MRDEKSHHQRSSVFWYQAVVGLRVGRSEKIRLRGDWNRADLVLVSRKVPA